MGKPRKLEREIAAALERDDLDAIVAALNRRGSGSAAVGADPGTARTADKRLAAKLIRAHFTDRPRDLSKWCRQLLRGVDDSAHEVGCCCCRMSTPASGLCAAAVAAPHHSPNWEVREFAGSTAGDILDRH
jgi:hypothetical protein